MTTAAVAKFKIESRTEMAADHVELLLEAPALAEAVPGQFVHVRTPGMLRRPISFSRLLPKTQQAGLLFQVVGEGTRWLAQQRPGQWLDVLGPLGHGFPAPDPDLPWCLVGGGVGIPPLYAALSAWRDSMRAPITAILGARRADYVIMAEDFSGLIGEVAITTDDGSRGERGTVLGPLRRWRARHPDGQIYACGPTPMLAGVSHVGAGAGKLYLALEQRMGCGVGACLACVVLAHGAPGEGPVWRRVCHDGPVFRGEELIWS
jgi:dihydroorotate dehydrogenase electron transfer subunit